MERATETKLFYRISAAADRLDISRSLAYELAQSGELETVRIGRSLRVPAVSLEAYAKRKMEEAGLVVTTT